MVDYIIFFLCSNNSSFIDCFKNQTFWRIMIRIFSFILFVIISNNAIATIKGKTLICDKDKRGYNFITRYKVEVYSINFDELNIISIKHSYELAENAIFIQRPLTEFNRKKIK